MDYLSTRQVARLLGVSVSLLTKAVWCGRVDPPQKSPSGNFLWTEADVEHAWSVLKPHGSQKGRRSASAPGDNARENANIRSRRRAAKQLPRQKARHKKAWVILNCLRDWLGRLFDRTVKAFFDAILEHYSW